VRNVVSSHQIRTGDHTQDQRQLNEAQQYANANGLQMQVQPLPHGGFQVDMVSPDPLPAPVYGAPPAYGAPPMYGAPPAPPAMPQAMVYQPPQPLAPIAPFGGAAPRPIQAAPTGTCRMCGRHAPTKQVTFHQNIGALVIRFPKTVSGQLCRDCIGTYFTKYTLTSLFLGWWGVISFFYTLVTIPMNIVTWFGARKLPRA
jgi:hypothetical protein